MTTDKTGGPAFPQKRIYRCSQGIDHEIHEQGMTLRDWFAGQATEEDIQNHLEHYLCDITSDCIPRYTREQAKYRYADAMLAERSR